MFSTPVYDLFLTVSGRISSSCNLVTRKAAETVKLAVLNSVLAGQGIAIMVNTEKAVLVRCVHLISCLPDNILTLSEITKEQLIYCNTVTSVIKPVQ